MLYGFLCSNVVCRVIEGEGGLGPLVSILKCSDVAGAIVEKVVEFIKCSLILARSQNIK